MANDVYNIKAQTPQLLDASTVSETSTPTANRYSLWSIFKRMGRCFVSMASTAKKAIKSIFSRRSMSTEMNDRLELFRSSKEEQSRIMAAKKKGACRIDIESVHQAAQRASHVVGDCIKQQR